MAQAGGAIVGTMEFQGPQAWHGNSHHPAPKGKETGRRVISTGGPHSSHLLPGEGGRPWNWLRLRGTEAHMGLGQVIKNERRFLVQLRFALRRQGLVTMSPRPPTPTATPAAQSIQGVSHITPLPFSSSTAPPASSGGDSRVEKIVTSMGPSFFKGRT